MNTTKLHIIAKSLVSEFQRCGTASAIQQVVASLEQLVRQPQQPAPQQQLSSQLTQLYKKLDTSPVEEYSPAWRDAMEEIKVSDKFGKSLKGKIENIIERNQITRQVALDELKKILTEIQTTERNLKGLVGGLEYFGVGEDELNSNECEVGVIVPRKYVENNLKNFGKELIELEKTLVVFSELSTGSRKPIQIRTISSSDLSVFLDFIPEIGACIAIAVERIVALYKQMLEIKKLKAELLKQNIPSDKLTGIDAHAESIVTPELEKIAEELIDKYGTHLDSNRKNEVSTELRHSLKRLANRIDRGFNIELRVAYIPDEPEDGEELSEQVLAIKQIVDSARQIDYSESSGEPVLFLIDDDNEDK